jgi:hypothetical protein
VKLLLQGQEYYSGKDCIDIENDYAKVNEGELHLDVLGKGKDIRYGCGNFHSLEWGTIRRQNPKDNFLLNWVGGFLFIYYFFNSIYKNDMDLYFINSKDK